MNSIRFSALSLAILALFASATTALATVTLEICYEDGRLANGSVGILVADVNEDGFLSPDDPAAVGTLLSPGETVGGGDDLILAVFQADDGPHWNGGAGIFATASALDYDALGISEGTPLALFLFPEIMTAGQSLVLGDQVITYRNDAVGGSGGTSSFSAPADSGVYTLSALQAPLDGDFDPGNPTGDEVYDEKFAGVVGGSGGGGDDHGDRRSDSTVATIGGSGTGGLLAPGDLDFFSVPVNGLAEVTIYTTGDIDTIGYLYGSDGSAVNDPAGDDDKGEGANFRSTEIVNEPGSLDLAVRGKGDNQDGAYDLFVEVLPLQPFRTDVTIGPSPVNQRGDGIYNQTGAGQAMSTKLKKLKTVRYFFTNQNDGGNADDISLRGSRGTSHFGVQYSRISEPAGNVTAEMITGAYAANLPARDAETLLMTIRGTGKLKKKGKGRGSFSVTGSSAGGGTDRAVGAVSAKLKQKKKKKK